MVKVIDVKNWGQLHHRNPKSHNLFYVVIYAVDDYYRVAEKLGIKFIFRKKNEMICSDGKLLYWYKP